MAIIFGLLAGALSVLLAVAAWAVIAENLRSEREAQAVIAATLHRAPVQAAVTNGQQQVVEALPSRASGGAALALVGGEWRANSPNYTADLLPTGLVATVAGGTDQVARVSVNGGDFYVVGLPLLPRGDAFFEWVPVGSLERTLQIVTAGLAASALVTTVLGILLGRAATRVALRPLNELSRVAARVAAGHLDARLATDVDPDLRDLATSFNGTIDELERRVATDARFAVDVSHELRTPLTTMLNSVQVISNRRDELPDAVREPLDLLTADVERFRMLVVDLLEFSRDDAGDRLVLEDVVIGDLVRRAADGAAGQAVTRVSAAAEGLVMGVEKRRMERVVVNLVNNARSHGGGCVRVHVTRSGDHVRILVDDDGPGIPEADRRRIFDRFARGTPGGASVDNDSGSGLGLAIVQRHVMLHGGRVSVGDSPEGGARFVVELPLAGPANRA